MAKKRETPKVEFRIKGEAIEISLPITTPTGKARVKRPVPGHAPNPVATRQVTMGEADYLEWQISYDTDSPSMNSALESVSFRRGGNERFGFELVWLLVKGREMNLIPPIKFQAIRDLVFEHSHPIA
jgi:hypothetical protein